MRVPRRSRGGVPGRPRSQISTSERMRSRRPILANIAPASSAGVFSGWAGVPGPVGYLHESPGGRAPEVPGDGGDPAAGGGAGASPAGEDEGREVQSNRRSGELGRRRVLGTGLARLDVE